MNNESLRLHQVVFKRHFICSGYHSNDQNELEKTQVTLVLLTLVSFCDPQSRSLLTQYVEAQNCRTLTYGFG